MSSDAKPLGRHDGSAALGLPVLQQTAVPHLEEGEQLLGAFHANLDPVLPLYQWPGHEMHIWRSCYRMIRRAFHGGSYGGPWEVSSRRATSTAFRFWEAVRTTQPGRTLPDWDPFAMVLTDRRMLILSMDYHDYRINAPYQAQLLLELPRGTYGLRPDTPPAHFGERLDLLFSDESWIALNVMQAGKADLTGEENKRQISSLLG